MESFENLVLEHLNLKEKIEIINNEEFTKDIQWVRISKIVDGTINGVISLSRNHGGNELIGFKVLKSELEGSDKLAESLKFYTINSVS